MTTKVKIYLDNRPYYNNKQKRYFLVYGDLISSYCFKLNQVKNILDNLDDHIWTTLDDCSEILMYKKEVTNSVLLRLKLNEV